MVVRILCVKDMVVYTAKRAIEILQEEGFLELSNRSRDFIKHQLGIGRCQFKYNTIKNEIMNKLYYDSPPNPDSPIFLNPNRIEYGIYEFSTGQNGLGKVKSGNWDHKSNCRLVANDDTIKGIRQRFEEDKNWEETVYYEQLKSKYDGDEKRIKNRCEFVDTLYQNIKNNGYRPARTNDNIRQRSGYGQHLEVLVVIDRNGNIYHQGKGSHRLGISKILNIEIPVQVLVRHKNWQKIRDDIYNNGLSDKYSKLQDHPDIQDTL